MFFKNHKQYAISYAPLKMVQGKICGGAGVLVCLMDFKSRYSESSQNGRFDSYAPPPY